MELIFKILEDKGFVGVTELQEQLGVSDMTVRRCLNQMASAGLIQRVHGGAKPIEEAQNLFMQLRHSINADIKNVLADKVLDFIPENGSIFLDSGTTCFAIAKRLAKSGRKLNVITDSIKIPQELQGIRHLNTTVLGGVLCDDMVTLDGHYAAEAASRVTLDVCVFSSDGFNVEQLDQQYLSGVMTKKVIISNSKIKLCVCDSTKFNMRCCFRFCGWDDIDIFLTDKGLPDAAKLAIEAKGVKLHQVDAVPSEV